MKIVEKIVICLCYIACMLMFLQASSNYSEFQTRNFAIAMLLYGLALIVFSNQFWRIFRKATFNVVKREIEKHSAIKDDIDLL